MTDDLCLRVQGSPKNSATCFWPFTSRKWKQKKGGNDHERHFSNLEERRKARSSLPVERAEIHLAESIEEFATKLNFYRLSETDILA